MALGATFSALEVVPLTLLTLDAWDFYRLTRGESAAGFRHRWTFFFLMAVGFWNFVGAGVFGFLINTPIVSYYEIGTILTVNHGHAAIWASSDAGRRADGLTCCARSRAMQFGRGSRSAWRIGFWGLNIGLAMMVVLQPVSRRAAASVGRARERLLARALASTIRRRACRARWNGCECRAISCSFSSAFSRSCSRCLFPIARCGAAR